MTTPRVGVIVLAAGRSTRFAGAGAHKLLATISGVPLVRLSVSAAVDADVGAVVVVTGPQATAVAQALDGLPIRLVNEPGFADGMATSLRRGVTAFEHDAEAVLISLGDQPGMRPDAYRRVVSQWRSSRSAIVVPRYAGDRAPAHPTLFAVEVWGELRALDGDAGARSVITRDPARVTEAQLEWPAPRDVDTLDDLAMLVGERASESQSPSVSRTAGPPTPTTTQ